MIEKNYHLLNEKLKSLGIKTERNKKNYSTKEKRHISRIYNKYKFEADSAYKPYATQTGQNITFTSRELKNRKEIKLARESGQVVYKNKIIIKHDVREKVRLKRSKNYVSGDKKVLQIELKKGSVTRNIQIAEKHDLMNFLNAMETVELPRGVKITVKIGKDSPFMTSASIATSHKQLLNYISNWEPKDIVSGKMTKEDGEKLRLELIGQMSIVEIN